MAEKYFITGNGKILCFSEALDIVSIQGDCYSSPPFCSFCYEGDCTCISSRCSGINSYTLYSSNGTRIANINDHADVKKPVFVREFEAYSEIMFKLIVPPYVRKYEYEKYDITDIKRPAFVLDIPAGIPFGYGCTTEKEKRLLIVSYGNIKFMDDTTFKIGRGKSKLIFAAGSPSDAVNAARYAIREKTASKWSERIKNIHSLVPASDKSDLNILLRNAVENLIMLQGEDGGIVSSCAEPQCDIRTLINAVHAFCEVKQPQRAKLALQYIVNAFGIDCDVLLTAGVSNRSGNVSAGSFKSPLCCKVINAFFAYFASSGNSLFLDSNREFLYKLMSICEKELYHFMLPFSADEHIDNIYPLYQGSTLNTLEFIKAAENMSKYFGESRFSDQAESVRQKLREHVYQDGVLYANYPNRVLGIKQSRFVYGKCISCSENEKLPYVRYLEKSRTGYYLCPECIADKDNGKKLFFDPYEKYVLPRTVFDVIYSGGFLSEKEAYDLIDKYIGEFISSDYKVFCGKDGNIALADICAMLSAASSVDHPESHTIARVISALVSDNGIFKEYNLKRKGCGTPSASSDSASLVLALSRYFKHF